jgi:exonuclease III
MAHFPKITIASINCNSLNISSMGSFNQKLKIYGVASLRTDLIFMSDIRLCNAQGVSSSNEICQSFRINPYGAYTFIHNSHSNKRGVGILIKNNSAITVTREWRDREDNILGLQLQSAGKTFNAVAIYGPNKVQPSFFDNLRNCLHDLGEHPLVMGGDWNCTLSTVSSDANIDVHRMQNLPNLTHSKLLAKLCKDLELCDPYRTKYPNRTDFTYIPSHAAKKTALE